MSRAANITIIDYERGNLFSIEQAVRHVGGSVEITRDPERIASADRVILPGVGAFGDAMRELREKALDAAVREFVSTGRPLLGICLGMQMLLSRSEEFGMHEGLNLIEGEVVRFSDPVDGGPRYKIPHISWCPVEMPGGQERGGWAADSLLFGVAPGASCYFVHSFTCCPHDKRHVFAESFYGRQRFCSVVRRENVWGCQFHPEKSGPVGLQIYRNFVHTL